MAEIILFADANFCGEHTHLFETTPDFTNLHLTGAKPEENETTWNDQVSSFVVVSGWWQFFKDPNFRLPQGDPRGVGPGLYRWVEAVGITNDSVSSIRLVRE